MSVLMILLAFCYFQANYFENNAHLARASQKCFLPNITNYRRFSAVCSNDYRMAWKLQQVLKQTKTKLMNNPFPSIFQSITPEIFVLLHNDPFCLQSTFSIRSPAGPEIHLAITNLYLTTFQPHSNAPQFLYQAQLSYDLKFQVIYHGVQTTKAIGFKIFKEKGKSLSLYPKVPSLIDLWIKQLGRNLNQVGFHQLFRPIKKIGAGGFAAVYEAERLSDQKHFAVKAFSKQNTILSSDLSKKMNLLNEIQLLRTFDSPHLIKCEGVFESQNSIYIVLQLLSEGQLHSRINCRKAQFSLQQIKEFLRGMALGLKQMHSFRVMHRDIKPENIMMREKQGLNPVIVDYGLSADVDSKDYIFYKCGTPGYVAPEITKLSKGQHVEPECDIFSLGAILHLLLLRKPLFGGRKSQEIYEENKKFDLNFNSPIYLQLDHDTRDLLTRMLALDPSKRIKAQEILKHPFLCNEMEIESEKQIISPKTINSSEEIDCLQEENY